MYNKDSRIVKGGNITGTLSETQIKSIYELGQQVPLLSDREIARQLGVSRDSAARYRGSVPDATQAQSVQSASMHVADARTNERLRTDNNRLRAMNRVLAGGGTVGVEGLMDQFREELSQEKFHNFKFTTKTYAQPKATNSIFDKNHEEIAALILSDWHGGCTIRAEESNGVNVYNSMVMANRAYEVVAKFKKILLGHMQMYKITKIWLPILGDMLSGSIHPDLVLTNDLLDIPAAILVGRLLIMVVLELKAIGLPIEIDTIVGNHPRTLAKMPAKRQAHLSLDWIAYMFLEQYFEDDPQVTVRVHTGQFGMVQHFGHRFVVEHGYGATKDTSIIQRIKNMMDNPTYRNATGLEGSSVDAVIIGDRHQATVGEGYIVNGCLCASDEYGISLRLAPIGAIQQMIGISKDHTRTFHYELDVTHNTSESADNPFSEYAAQFMVEHGR